MVTSPLFPVSPYMWVGEQVRKPPHEEIHLATTSPTHAQATKPVYKPPHEEIRSATTSPAHTWAAESLHKPPCEKTRPTATSPACLQAAELAHKPYKETHPTADFPAHAPFHEEGLSRGRGHRKAKVAHGGVLTHHAPVATGLQVKHNLNNIAEESKDHVMNNCILLRPCEWELDKLWV